MMELYNCAHAKALFEREAVLMGSEDRVPCFRATALFGKDAVEHARRLGSERPGRYTNGYGAGSCTLDALTFRGFQAAVSFYNVQQLRKEAQT